MTARNKAEADGAAACLGMADDTPDISLRGSLSRDEAVVHVHVGLAHNVQPARASTCHTAMWEEPDAHARM